MANVCNTSYHIYSDDSSVLNNIYDTLMKGMKESTYDISLSEAILLLGGDPSGKYLRGEIYEIEISDDCLSVFMNTAWDEMPDFRHFLIDKFGVHIDYLAEEPGCGIYRTNYDVGGEYHIEVYENGDIVDSGYDYADFGTIASEVKEITGKTATTYEDLVGIIKEYNKQHEDEDSYISVEEVIYTD